MKIRPLKKINAGHYMSHDETIDIYYEIFPKAWSAYRNGEYILYDAYPTLKLLIKSLESLYYGHDMVKIAQWFTKEFVANEINFSTPSRLPLSLRDSVITEMVTNTFYGYPDVKAALFHLEELGYFWEGK